MTYHERAEEILRDWSMSGMHADDDCGHVDETGFWAAIFRGPLETRIVFHVSGLPADGYSWQTPPLRDLVNDFYTLTDATSLARQLKSAGIIPEPDIHVLKPDEDALELAALHPEAVGYILETDERGFWSYTVFVETAALDLQWQLLQRLDTENRGPDEDDGVISSNGFVLAVSLGSDFLGQWHDETRAREVLRAAMERAQYWPNVWEISDHGNAHLISEDFYKETAHLAKGEDA